jgi:hypothetical protein
LPVKLRTRRTRRCRWLKTVLPWPVCRPVVFRFASSPKMFGMPSAAALLKVREENMGDPIYAEIAESYFASLEEIG